MDIVTGLVTRSEGELVVRRELAYARQHSTPLTLMYVDVDGFKRFNDEASHNLGDEVLKLVAQNSLRHNAHRPHDCAIRWGGDEFLLVLPDLSAIDAAGVAERIRDSIDQSVLGIRLTVSIGLTTIGESESFEEALQRVDLAMFRAKRQGRNRISVA